MRCRVWELVTDVDDQRKPSPKNAMGKAKANLYLDWRIPEQLSNWEHEIPLALKVMGGGGKRKGCNEDSRTAESVSRNPCPLLPFHSPCHGLYRVWYSDWVLNAETPGFLVLLGSGTLATRPSLNQVGNLKSLWEIWPAQEKRLNRWFIYPWHQGSQQTVQPSHS